MHIAVIDWGLHYPCTLWQKESSVVVLLFMIMSSYEKLENISFTLFIDDKENKVLYAEAGRDFVDILFSLLTLPLGTISRLVSKDSTVEPCRFNSISSLRQSVETMDTKYFSEDANNEKLLNPTNSMEEGWRTLAYDFDDAELSKFFIGYIRYYEPKLFIVSDCLRGMDSDIKTTLWILRNFGI